MLIKRQKRQVNLQKVFSFFFLILLLFQLPAFAQSADEELGEQKVLKGYVSKVPIGTKLKIIVETPIDEIASKVDDEFTARTAEDIVVDGKVVIVAGSAVRGTISEVNSAKRLHKAGSVRIEFKNLMTPDGRQIPIVASVLTHSGLLKGKLTKKNALISGATIVAPIVAGTGAGLVATSDSALGPVVGAAVGAIAGLALFAFERGNKVDIKAGDELKIELTEEALIPASTGEEGGESEKSEKSETNLLKQGTNSIEKDTKKVEYGLESQSKDSL